MLGFISAFLVYGIFAAIFLRRLFPIWTAAIPGGLEDTRIFLWNAWWVHHAFQQHLNPFHTTFLFHPFGCSLISHDFPLWSNLVTELAQQAGMPLAAACNFWFLLTWALGGACTFLLVRELTGESAPAGVAGLFVMTHSYTLARAMQNWGQFNLFGIPLFLWALVRARRSGKRSDFCMAGLALAWTAACHYYFLVYSGVIWLAVAALDIFPVAGDLEILYRPSQVRKPLLIVAVMAAITASAILLHPGQLTVGRIKIGLHGPENALLVMWLALFGCGLSFLRLAIIPPATSAQDRKAGLVHHGILLLTALVCLSPLLWEAVLLVLQGGYPKQNILWKTHLPGANLLALFSPNALHALLGPAVSKVFSSNGMNSQEQAASIGWVCLAAVAFSRATWRRPDGGRWLALAIAGTILAMGTYLHIGPWNLWCPLPFYFLRLLPVLGNVRVPERWMAVGAVAWAVVLGMALVRIARQKNWPLKTICLIAGLLVLLENWPGIPVRPMPERLTVYDRLRNLPDGAVLPLPLYIGDSSIGSGDAIPAGFNFPWDHLGAQIYHEKPVLGGFIGRIPRKLIRDYQANPFFDRLLKLEEGAPSRDPDPTAGAEAVKAFNFRYVLVYPNCVRPEALRYALKSLALDPIELSGPVQLYQVRP